MGEYIGRIYEEVRDRPKYMTARQVNLLGSLYLCRQVLTQMKNGAGA